MTLNRTICWVSVRDFVFNRCDCFENPLENRWRFTRRSGSSPGQTVVLFAFLLHTIDRSLSCGATLDIRHRDSSRDRDDECNRGDAACSGQVEIHGQFLIMMAFDYPIRHPSRACLAIVMRGGPVDKPAALARLPLRATLANGTGRDSSVVRDQ
ncbi:hypothetical protein [Burkholderia sp. BE17]|uniref:hypothetical protein n=1 Tax=Burkholderia sp. BE17 TaxID=2656644 RepID=UPI00128C47B3|nr:hypothetical protein [Burkholderia sp. BE17]MPV67371.1 hypothetical protein [Burkholderia sp. BE17]